MVLEQKIIEAKAKRQVQIIRIVIGLVSVSLLVLSIVLYKVCCQVNVDVADVVALNIKQSTEEGVIQAPTVAEEQLRQSYIDTLSHYENNLKPELNKIDLAKWDKPRFQHLQRLEDESLSKFSDADYAGAVQAAKELTQFAQTLIGDSQQAFAEAMSGAKSSYNADNYNDAAIQIANALMLDKTSIEAETLAAKIDKVPEIVTLMDNINTARVENKLEKELGLIKELIKFVPERTVVAERKQKLIQIINERNFNSYIRQSHQAIAKGDSGQAKRNISAAKKIFPHRQEIADAVAALQELEKNYRFELYNTNAVAAIAADDWVGAEKQLQLALQEDGTDNFTQKSLANATKIISLNNEFEQHINNPYRLSNKPLVSKLKEKITDAAALTKISPSLNKKTVTLSALIKSMGKKVTVEVVSDNQTDILVRGVGVIGLTLLKTIQLTPGRYRFEGKRKGFKSKLVEVLIPYDQTTFSLNIQCDDPI